MNPDILVVGAGPIGLLSAILAQLHNPKANILLFERNQEYTRHHTLLVDAEAFNGSHPDERLQSILKDFHGPVPTSTIESKLKQLALDLGVQTQHEKIEDPEALLARYPTAHTLVGADGAHSIVRKKLFADEKSIDENLQYIVEVKYHVRGATQAIEPSTYLPALSQTEHFVSEQVGRKKQGKTPVSLFFFVDEATYQDVYAKKKLKLTDLVNPESKNLTRLANSIRPWLALRRTALQENRVEGSDGIAGVALSTYSAKTLVKSLPNNKRVILLGDAGSGVPFNRAFNAGVERAILASTWLASPPQADDQNNIAALNQALQKQIAGEIARAKRTNHKVQFGKAISSLKQDMSYSVAASALDHDYLEAMQEARVERLSFFRRNPRLTLTGVTWVALTIVGFIVFPPLMASWYVAVGASILLPLVAIAIGVAVYQGIAACLEPNEVDTSPPHQIPFPWEEQLSKEQATQIQDEKRIEEAKDALMQDSEYRQLKADISQEKKALQRLQDNRVVLENQKRPPSLFLFFPDARVHVPYGLANQSQINAQMDNALIEIDKQINSHQSSLHELKLQKWTRVENQLKQAEGKQEEVYFPTL